MRNANDKALNHKSLMTNRNEVSKRVQEKLRNDDTSTNGCIHCHNSNEEAIMFLKN